MAFERPTLQALITRAEGDIKSGLGLVTLLKRSFLKVMARVLAGLAHLLFGYIKFIEKQAFPDTATGEYLLQWAAIWEVEQKAAVFAEFTVTATGLPGTIIPVGREYRRTDGASYTTQAEVTLTTGADPVSLIASVAGHSSTVAVADVVTIAAPIAGLDSDAFVQSVEVDGEDTESESSLQARLLDRIRNPPSGGSATDYIQWALEVPGVTRAWVGPLALGPGTVTVWIVTDDTTPITPSPAKLTEAAAYIQTVRPVGADVQVTGPVLLPLDMLIALRSNTAATQAAVVAELKDMLARDTNVAGAYQSPGVTYSGKVYLSRINEAISTAVGEEDHTIISINGNPPADVVPAAGKLVTLGVVTWQTLLQ